MLIPAAALLLAGETRSQVNQRLVFSKHALALRPVDSLSIRNPNSVDVACDSIVVCTEAPLISLFIFQHGFRDLQFGMDNGKLAASGALPYCKTFRYPAHEVVFSSKKTIQVWTPYIDACPVCKVSAAAAIPPRDSIHLEFTFHYGRLSDSILLYGPKAGTIGIRRDPSRAAAWKPREGGNGFDASGRRWAMEGIRDRIFFTP
jgi:hypothetical protein